MERRNVSPETALASDIFDKYCSANTLKGILGQYRQLCNVLRLKPTHFPEFYPRLRAKLSSWRAQGLWAKFEKRASQKCYGRGKACVGTRVLIIGAGPCGLRAAIEAQLLGAKVVLVEKRDRFSRNNVLHLWPFVITDLKALGAKKFYGKFCAGSIDHISIRQLQCILLKVALLLGVEVHEGVGFEGLRKPTENEGWRAHTSPPDHPVSHYTFDVLIGADGRRNTLDGFKRKALRAKLAIAITANFINKHTEAEARVKEISGVSYIFNQKFFQDLCEATGIDLENIVYYKDETHYFVMTAKKQSLLNKGVLLHDYADTAKLLSHENISTDALMVYALEAATFATEYQLPDIEFAVNHYGQPDVAMFDFTAMYAAENACRVVQQKGHKLLMTLVGDSLLEPFWPTGSGCARGFLSSFDACWMIRSWSGGVKSVLDVVAERESIYRLLGQTTPENLHKEHMGYTIDPHTRYPNLNPRLVMPFQVKSLFESDEEIPDLPDGLCDAAAEDKYPKKRRRDSVIAIDSLLTWLRDQVSCYNLQVIDVREAFVEGNVLCAVIHRFRPDLIEFPLPSEENVDPLMTAAFRNQLAFDILHQEYGISHVMSGFESVQFGFADFLSLVAYLSQLYEIFRGEIPQTKYFKSESGDELEDLQHHPEHIQAMKELRMAVTAKHHFSQKQTQSRKSRLSSSREGDDSYRRHRKRRSEEKAIRPGCSTGDIRPMSIQTLSAKEVAEESKKLQDRHLDIERFMRSMRLLQINQGIDPDDDDEEPLDNEFKDVSLHLYRKTVPDFDERRKNLEQKLVGRESKPVYGKRIGESQSDSEKVVPGLAKNLEAQLRYRGTAKDEKQKPKDLIRAIGKIEKSDWNVQLIEKKIAETKAASSSSKRDKDNKVPRWSREAYDDKLEAMKRKMDTATTSTSSQPDEIVDDTMRKIGNKIKHGSALEVGQRGSNKVSAMAEQLIHKLETKSTEVPAARPMPSKPVFELPKKGKVDLCHFCKERVYVVERMTAEGKFFHRNCFRCEYCNTSLRIGNYVFDREGRYGERFYCSPHYHTVRLYGWKKFERPDGESEKIQKGATNLLGTPSQQNCRPKTVAGAKINSKFLMKILSEMDDRGTTPERVEFENSVDFASEEELLNEMDEDEWTDRNFGASNADNTSDEASSAELTDEEVTPEGATGPSNTKAEAEKEDVQPAESESSDSDTEVASEEGEDEDSEEEEEDEDEDDEEDDDDYEEECEGSTTEIETDSEFAEDPPNSVPGGIPTIVVDAPEQLVTKLVDANAVNHAKHVHHRHHHHHHQKETKVPEQRGRENQPRLRNLYDDDSIELVKKGGPERQLPVVTKTPKMWEPLGNNPERLASKASLELKKKYLQGSSNMQANPTTKKPDPAAQHQFRSFIDMISEQQKLLQPGPKHSATMQAILEGAEKLKNKPVIVPIPLNRNWSFGLTENLNKDSNQIVNDSAETLCPDSVTNNANTLVQPVSPSTISSETDKTLKDATNLLISTLSCDLNEIANTASVLSLESESKDDVEKAEDPQPNFSDDFSGIMTTSDTPSFSTSETSTNNTVIDAKEVGAALDEVESNSDTEVGSEPYSDLDDLDDEDVPKRPVHNPPRVEIEDEFGVTKELLESPSQNAHEDPEQQPASHSFVKNSSSESSLNSGFLETEMSDYIGDDSVADHKPTHRSKSANKLKHEYKRKSSEKAKSNTPNKLPEAQPSLCLEFEALDFADMDGGISPEHEEIQPQGSRSSHPCLSDSHSPSITSPSEDDRSSVSTRDGNGPSTSEADLSDSLQLSGSEPHVRFQNDIFSAKPMLKSSTAAPVLERVVPFSGVRDSLDYRKLKNNASSPRNDQNIYQSSNVFKQQPEQVRKFSEPALGCDHEVVLVPTSTDDSNYSNGSPSTTRKLHEIQKERIAQNDIIRSMVLGRIKRSPEKQTRRNSKQSTIPPLNQDDTSYKNKTEIQDNTVTFDHQMRFGNESSSEMSSVPGAPHSSLVEANSVNESEGSGSNSDKTPHTPVYEPVFSSPRFRSRCRAEKEGMMSKTEPHTPVLEKQDPFLTKGNKDVFICQTVNPLFRSMPNLADNKLSLSIAPPLQKETNSDTKYNAGESRQYGYGDPGATNPFLVSQSPTRPPLIENQDDFVQLHLRIRPNGEGRCPVKSKSMYAAASSEEYFHPELQANGRNSQENLNGVEGCSRRRANTVANLNQMQNQYHLFNSPSTSNSSTNVRHSIDTAEALKKKTMSSHTLQDNAARGLSENGRRTSVPDINTTTTVDPFVLKGSKGTSRGKDRERRKSLIQAVSDFFNTRVTPTVPGEKSSSPPENSPTKEKFSLFKFTPKLLQGKDKKNSKSRDPFLTSTEARSDENEFVIQELCASPTNMHGHGEESKQVDECARDLASMSIIPAPSKRPTRSDRKRRESSRAREMEEIQLQLESIEADQRALESRGVYIEKKLRGEESDDTRSDNEVLDEWFSLVREKTKLARFEKELMVRAQELDLEARREKLTEQLEQSQASKDHQIEKEREIEILKELKQLDDQHSHLLSSIHADMEEYSPEEPGVKLGQTSTSRSGRLESDV